jgi:FAD/FMN-containing dehydrogenase
VISRLAEFPKSGLSRTLVQKLAPAAAHGQGHVIVLSNPDGLEMTRQSAWGGIDASLATVMSEVKKQFDPKNILNPGRVVYV